VQEFAIGAIVPMMEDIAEKFANLQQLGIYTEIRTIPTISALFMP